MYTEHKMHDQQKITSVLMLVNFKVCIKFDVCDGTHWLEHQFSHRYISVMLDNAQIKIQTHIGKCF